MSEIKDGNNTLTYVLPDVIDPPDTICVTLRIPNNKFHIMAFKGAIWDLCNWWNWEKDDGKNATKVAQVWRRVFRSMLFGNCEQPIAPQGALVEINDMGDLIQVICDDNGNCIQQYRCDVCGSWHTNATVDQLNTPSQPSSGSPQPAPGGTSCYDMVLNANSKWWLHAPLNTGDVVTLSSLTGTANDGTDSTLYCGGGSVYYGGDCNTGGAHTVSTDPLNTKPHMTILLVVNGVYYDVANAPATIAAGVVNLQGYLQVNDATIANCTGQHHGSLCQKNNQVGVWSHTFDFTANDGAWITDGPFFADPGSGNWIGGSGWSTGDISTPQYRRIIEVEREFVSTTITSMDMEYNLTKGASYDGGSVGVEMFVGANHVININWASAINGTNIHETWLGSYTVTSLGIQIQSSLYSSGGSPTFDGSALLTKVVVTGTGTNPFV